MWRHFRLSLALVTTDNVVIVYWKPLVGIDSDTEETRVGIDQESDVTFGQIVDDRGFREIGHVSQILKQFILWRILLFNFVVRIGFFFAIFTENLKFIFNDRCYCSYESIIATSG